MNVGPSSLVALYDHLVSTVDQTRPCIVGRKPFTYGDLFDRVARLGSFYREVGLAQGARVVVLTRDEVEFIAIDFSLLRCGLVGVLLSPDLGALEIKNVIEVAMPSLIFADSDIVDIAELPHEKKNYELVELTNGNNPPPVGRPRRGTAYYHELLGHFSSTASFRPFVGDDALASIIFTSGTTSTPKGVVTSHRRHALQAVRQISCYGYGTDTVLMTATSLYLAYARNVAGRVILAGGTVLPCSADRPSDIQSLLRAIPFYRVTHLAATPRTLEMILRYGDELLDSFQVQGFKHIMSCTSRLTKELWEKCEEEFGTVIVDRYTSTEAGDIAYCGPDPSTRRMGSLGKPAQCEIKIIDDEGHPVPPNETGELIVRSDTLMNEYYGMPIETAAVLKEGWYFTGDLVIQDAEGFLYYRGRKRDMINCGGIKILPDEVSGVLMSISGISEAATFGDIDPVLGEIIVACVVPTVGEALSETVIVKEFLRRASPKLLPRRIHIMESLPRTPGGKVQLAQLKRLVDVPIQSHVGDTSRVSNDG